MISVNDLTYQYPNTNHPSLKQISIEVRQGETLGILGANGSGKSTLCYALMGLIPHFYKGDYAGQVTVDGIRVASSHMGEMAQHAALVFQNPIHQFSGAKLTVEDEIAFGMENLGLERAVMRERMEWVSGMLRITHLLQRNPYQLSGGQMQRVAIASVLALRPQVLILDEPTSQLDPLGTAEVFETLRTLQREGMTTVIVEHKSELLVDSCDKLCVLKDAQVQIVDRPSVVFGHPDVLQWGIEVPRYSQVFKAFVPAASDVPTTLQETVERLEKYVVDHD